MRLLRRYAFRNDMGRIKLSVPRTPLRLSSMWSASRTKTHPYFPGRGLDKNHHYNYIVNIVELSFEWDDKKSLANKKKHGISFEEAQTVFFDEHALLIYDPDHSRGKIGLFSLG